MRGSCTAPDTALPSRRVLGARLLPMQLSASAAPSPQLGLFPPCAGHRLSVGPPILHLMVIATLDLLLPQHSQWKQAAQACVLH